MKIPIEASQPHSAFDILSCLEKIEDQIDRQQAEAIKLEREAGELARQLSEIREEVCRLLKEMEGSE